MPRKLHSFLKKTFIMHAVNNAQGKLERTSSNEAQTEKIRHLSGAGRINVYVPLWFSQEGIDVD